MDLYSVGLLLLPIILTIPVILLSNWRFRKDRKDPFNALEIERPAAFSLDHQLDDMAHDLANFIFRLTVFGAGVALVNQDVNISSFTKLILVLFLSSLILWQLVQISKWSSRRRNIINARDAERIVGQSLTQLLVRGFHVFHDIPCGNFNIDHVVVGPAGVFAIETKSRRKDIDNNGHKVVIENGLLNFPTWKEIKPIEQAERQALWLSKELSQSTGESTFVAPMLVFPGWWVERKEKPRIPVLNHKELINPRSYTAQVSLTESQVKRITHQLKQMQIK